VQRTWYAVRTPSLHWIVRGWLYMNGINLLQF
jgi:hypothetical protein